MFLLFSCSKDLQPADLIIYNARIYTVDTSFSVVEAIAINAGKIVFAGKYSELKEKFSAKDSLNAKGKFIFPGFIDAHCHFYGYGKGLNELDLVGTNSFNQVITSLINYANKNDLYPEKKDVQLKDQNWIIGRGWDQNDWENKEYPNKTKLDSLFPSTPVLLKRIDGHAVLVNQRALSIAGFTERTRISGGELILKNGKLTGVLVDNAADELEKFIPKQNKELIQKALLKAQDSCVKMGLTTVDDAGLEKNVIDVMDEIQRNKQLKMRVYAMLTPSAENIQHYLKSGTYKTDKLNVRSFKFYGDGALGSRGACLLKNYSDKDNWKGFLLSPPDYYSQSANTFYNHKFQMNVHCIGDSAVRAILNVCATTPVTNPDMLHEIGINRRWRIEHAQIVAKDDLKYFRLLGIIPSVQPTHATSDMYWAEKRLGKERVKDAYAYKELLDAAGIIALGTDFPVEDISPFKTFYAAVYRKDSKGFPENGFQMENALSRIETIKGMTIWAAYSNFEEKEKGSIEVGKFADLVILDTDLMNCNEKEILQAKVISTIIGGEKVYTKK